MEDIWRDILLLLKYYIVMWKGLLNEWKKIYNLVYKGIIKKGYSGKIIFRFRKYVKEIYKIGEF